MTLKFSLIKFIGIIIVVIVLLTAAKIYNKKLAQEKEIANEAKVEVNIKPLVLEIGKKPEFEIYFDTHSGSLDFEVGKVTFLKDEKGKIYNKSSWLGSPPGGHHRKGKLIFETTLPKTQKITLYFKGFSQIEGKEYIYNL